MKCSADEHAQSEKQNLILGLSLITTRLNSSRGKRGKSKANTDWNVLLYLVQ